MMTRKGGLKGADRLARRLEDWRESARQGAFRAVAQSAGELSRDVRRVLRHAPGHLPRLADHVKVEGEGADRSVVIDHPAAPFVEFGTRRIPPHPFLQPAADAARVSFRKRIIGMIGRILRSGT